MAPPRSLRALLRWLPLAAVVAAGCDQGDPTVTGELNRGVFEYVCVDAEADVHCRDLFTAETFPRVFAVGGRFSIRFTASDGGREPVVEPAAREFIVQEGEILRFSRPGTAAILATRDDELIDYRHLDASVVADIRLQREAGQSVSQLDLLSEFEVPLEAVPVSADGQPLGGALPYAWTVADPGVAQIVSLDTVRRVQVLGVASGQTTIEVSVGETRVSIPVLVDLAGSETGGDTDTDAGGFE